MVIRSFTIMIILFFASKSLGFDGRMFFHSNPSSLVTLTLYQGQGVIGECGWSTNPWYCTASSSDTNPFTSPCWGGQSTYGTCTFGEGGTCPAWVTADDTQKAGACP